MCCGVLVLVQEVAPAHSSFLSTALPLMQEAMMMIQADVSPPPRRLIDSAGSVPLSFLIGNGCQPTLPQRKGGVLTSS